MRSDIATADATISDIDLVKAGAGPWFLSTTHDLAIRFFGSAITSPLPTVIPISAFLTDRGQLNVGADLLVLGFPLGLRGQHYEAVVARRAMVASVGAKYTLLDAFVFPGNSGGPVVYAPAVKFGTGFSSPLINEEKLVGVVQSYLPYQEPAVSPVTQRPRVIFEENSSLSEMIPATAIVELLNQQDVQQALKIWQQRTSGK